jgi:hypothetical protein
VIARRQRADDPVELRFIDLFLMIVAALVVVTLVVLLRGLRSDDPPRIVVRSLPRAVVGEHYEVPLASSGGTEPLRWRLVGGQPPRGMRLELDGLLHGVARRADERVLRVALADADGRSVERSLALGAATAPPREPAVRERPRFELPAVVLRDGASRVRYVESLRTEGRASGIAWRVTSGKLPPGVTLASSGVLSGVPRVGALGPWVAWLRPRARARARRRAGTYRFTVEATDGVRSVRGVAVLYVRPDKGGLVRRLVTGETNGGLESLASVVVRIAAVLCAAVLAFIAALPIWMMLFGHDGIPIDPFGLRGRFRRSGSAA